MKIDHIGIAVESLENSLACYRDVLGLNYKGQEKVEDQGVKVAFLELGESNIELLEPLHEDSPIASHLEKRGEGIHHIAIEVEKELEEKVEKMQAEGVDFIGDKPTTGAEGKKIIFIHPKSTHGVLMELCQE